MRRKRYEYSVYQRQSEQRRKYGSSCSVLEKVRAADFIVIGSPLYWHNICGAVRNLLDRFYGPVEAGSLHGQIAFLFQGAAPEKWMLEAGEYTMRRFADLYGLTYLGMVTSVREADVLAAKIG